MKRKNKELLDDFTKYCIAHPEQRFWQALRNWVGDHYILASNFNPTMDNGEEGREEYLVDTFYWEGKNG